MFDWVCFGLDTNYEYDSSENFVVEMSWTGSTPVFPADLDTNYKQWLEDSSVQLCSIIVQQDPSFECSTNVVVSTFIENILTKSLPFFYTAKDGNVLVSQCCYSDSQFKVPSALQPNIKMTVAPVSYLDNFNLNLGASSIYSRTEILTPLQAPVKVDFKTALQNFLNTCTADSNGFCEVPLSLASSGADGKLRVQNLKIELTA